MWDVFALTVLAEIVFVYCPGFSLLRALRFSSVLSLTLSPIISISVYSIIGIVFGKCGIYCGWQTAVMPFFIFCLIVYLLLTFVTKKGLVHESKKMPSSTEGGSIAITLALYVVISFLIVFFYFILPLNGAGSFNQGPDNAPHLSLIQSFLDSGNYSSLNASYYHNIENAFQDPTGNGGTSGFYPAAWHCVTALAGSLTGANAAVASNASLFVFLAIIFPLNMYALLNVLFGNNRLLLLAGGLVVLGFGAFPWGLLSFGPLYPNFSAFAMVPAFVAMFVYAFKAHMRTKGRVVTLAVFVFGLPGLALLQTNAVFTLGVLLVPFCFGLIWRTVGSSRKESRQRLIIQIAAVVCFLLICALIWMISYNLPIMKGIVSYPWPSFTSLRQELVNIAFLSYRESPAQPLMGLLVILGIIWLLKNKRNRWLIFSYLITCFMCLVAATINGEFRSLLIGFWYTDSYRIAAMAALAAIPLASTGLYWLFSLILEIWDKKAESKKLNRRYSIFQKTIISLAIMAFLYYPNFSICGVGSFKTALGEFEDAWFNTNNNIGACVLDHEEQEFLAEVKDVVGDSLVINKPDDGSVFAYGANDIDVFYKRTGIEAYLTDSEESQLFRNELNEYAYNQDVQEAIDTTEAKYLLLLDYDVDDVTQNRYWFDHYYEDLWKGMDSVNDNTPGFKVVLSEGDMRLYEIEPVK